MSENIENSMPQNSQPSQTTGIKNIQNNITTTKSYILSDLEKKAVKLIILDYFELGNLTPHVKRNVLKKIKDELSSISETQLNKLYKDTEAEFYQKLPRKNPEQIINKINAQADYLIDKILDESEKDIVDQSNAINKLTETVAKVNRVMDVAPIVQINFNQEIPESTLLNPKQIINQGEL